MVVRIVVDPPVIRSDFNNAIKQCLRAYGQADGNVIGALIIVFRDYCEEHRESRNFKFTLYCEGRKRLSFRVKGGWSFFTRTKYKVTPERIMRRDFVGRLKENWRTLLIITRRALQVASFALKMAGLPHVAWFLDRAGNLVQAAIDYNKKPSYQRALGYLM